MIVCTIDYCQEAIDAERRLNRGERQLYCGQCGGLWVWPEECQHENRLSYAQFRELCRSMRRQALAISADVEGVGRNR